MNANGFMIAQEQDNARIEFVIRTNSPSLKMPTKPYQFSNYPVFGAEKGLDKYYTDIVEIKAPDRKAIKQAMIDGVPIVSPEEIKSLSCFGKNDIYFLNTPKNCKEIKEYYKTRIDIAHFIDKFVDKIIEIFTINDDTNIDIDMDYELYLAIVNLEK